MMKHYKKWVWQWMQLTAERQARNGEVTNWKGARDGANGGMIDVTLLLGEGKGGGKWGGRRKPLLTFFSACHFAFVSAGAPPSSPSSSSPLLPLLPHHLTGGLAAPPPPTLTWHYGSLWGWNAANREHLKRASLKSHFCPFLPFSALFFRRRRSDGDIGRD